MVERPLFPRTTLPSCYFFSSVLAVDGTRALIDSCVVVVVFCFLFCFLWRKKREEKEKKKKKKKRKEKKAADPILPFFPQSCPGNHRQPISACLILPFPIMPRQPVFPANCCHANFPIDAYLSSHWPVAFRGWDGLLQSFFYLMLLTRYK